MEILGEVETMIYDCINREHCINKGLCPKYNEGNLSIDFMSEEEACRK